MTEKGFEKEYLDKFIQFFNKAKFSSTYKLVFLKSMMDISEYDKDNEESVLGHKWITQNEDVLQVDLNFIAVRYAKYYWDMFYKFRLRQSQTPLDVNIHEFFKENETAIKPPKNMKDLANGFDDLRKNVIANSIRPQVLKFLLNDADFYKRILNKPYIEFDLRVISFLDKFKKVLTLALNYELTKYLEKINFSPRIAEKVSGKIPRDRLKPEEEEYLMKFHNECFYCKCKSKKYDIDHVIPFDYVFKIDVFNCVPACTTCNSSKSNKLPKENFFIEKLQKNEEMELGSEYTKEWYQKLYDNCKVEYHGINEFFSPKNPCS